MEGEQFIECRKFKVTLISAFDLEDVRKIFRMKVYATVSFGDDDKTEKRTKADEYGETSPRWGSSMQYTIGESAVIHHGLILVIKLYCKRKLGDRYIGEVHALIKNLFDCATQYGGSRSADVTWPVQKGCDSSQGMLRFSYRFGDKIVIERPPLWKKLLQSGAAVLLRVTLISTTGVDLPIEEIPIFTNPVVIE
ncbi:hypothetical protein LOK49_LG08G01662 [Camellia lanceoleosa]|uniref:Uncharacterized protein n=1 Tax=Camellia lanceoleosa TaxID=1840588 RepID=A0ACC0GRP0_9ERIC|nr:hypothetical protein LOK49_LG08G01662 [Camellia lanceoleosa]